MGLPKLFEASAIKKIVQSNIRLLPVVEGSLLEPEYFPCPNQLEHTRREYMKQT